MKSVIKHSRSQNACVYTNLTFLSEDRDTVGIRNVVIMMVFLHSEISNRELRNTVQEW